MLTKGCIGSCLCWLLSEIVVDYVSATCIFSAGSGCGRLPVAAAVQLWRAAASWWFWVRVVRWCCGVCGSLYQSCTTCKYYCVYDEALLQIAWHWALFAPCAAALAISRTMSHVAEFRCWLWFWFCYGATQTILTIFIEQVFPHPYSDCVLLLLSSMISLPFIEGLYEDLFILATVFVCCSVYYGPCCCIEPWVFLFLPCVAVFISS